MDWNALWISVELGLWTVVLLLPLGVFLGHFLALIYGLVDTHEYLLMNPNGTVPTLKDGDNPPLWETGAILRYLANTYAPENFWPTDPVARADIDRWTEWSKINIALNFTA